MFINYKTLSKEERLFVLKILIEHNYHWHGDDEYTPEEVERDYSFIYWPTIQIDVANNYLAGLGSGSSTYNINTPQGLFSYLGISVTTPRGNKHFPHV